jgi:hypothetical protein
MGESKDVYITLVGALEREFISEKRVRAWMKEHLNASAEERARADALLVSILETQTRALDAIDVFRKEFSPETIAAWDAERKKHV